MLTIAVVRQELEKLLLQRLCLNIRSDRSIEFVSHETSNNCAVY